MLNRDALRDAIIPALTFCVCLAVSAQTSMYAYRAATYDRITAMEALRLQIPPPAFKAQVDRAVDKLEQLDTRLRAVEQGRKP